jgi:gamma-glutamylcyclotransferase (GGCT)/AIG2-like uncharacterized protein YtfP
MNTLALATRRARPTRTTSQSIVLLGRNDMPIQLPGDVRLSPSAHLYFAYGADLCEPLLRRRCPDVRVIGRASLRGFSLAFAGTSKTWGGATLTLVPTEGSHVHGVVYLVSQLSLADLDRVQGCPRVYQRVTVQIADTQGMRADAHAYCMRPPLAGGVPSDPYFDLMTREYDRLGIDPRPLAVALDNGASARGLARGGSR